jgi:TonB family protein
MDYDDYRRDMPLPASFLPPSPPLVHEWATIARVGFEAGPRAIWPASWWTGMAASLGLHGAVVAAAIGLGAGWALVLVPPRNDISASAQRQGSAIVMEASWVRPEQEQVVKVSIARSEHGVQDAATALTQSIDHRRGEIEFDPIETLEPAPAAAFAMAAERASGEEGSPPAAANHAETRPAIARNRAAEASSFSGAFNSRAARGTKSNAPPRTVFSPDPIYPPELLAARQGGRVLVRIRVTAAGVVTAAALHQTSGRAAFDRSALEAVRNWRFEPIVGAPHTGVEAIVPVRFEIAEQRP